MQPYYYQYNNNNNNTVTKLDKLFLQIKIDSLKVMNGLIKKNENRYEIPLSNQFIHSLVLIYQLSLY